MLPSADVLKQAFLDLTEPVIFKGFPKEILNENNPEFLRWGPEKFAEKLGDRSLEFRTGLNARTVEPQWEVQCSIEKISLSDFIKGLETGDDKWRYFDYKYMNQWFETDEKFLQAIDWKRFGIDKNGNDSTLWIGSKNAHTNCHQDSYGCNLIAQIHGRKQWLLFPPDTGEKIKPTRIPYEESTIYSKINFFCPTVEDENFIMRIDKKARLVILEPGDVLFVPNGWWHYVESLEFSISINVWLPMDKDHKERIKEALVKLLVTEFDKNAPKPESEIDYTNLEKIELIKASIDEYKKFFNNAGTSPELKKVKRSVPWTSELLTIEYPKSVKSVPELSSENLRELLINNRNRFPDLNIAKGNVNPTRKLSDDIINAFCNTEIISKVSDLLLNDQ